MRQIGAETTSGLRRARLIGRDRELSTLRVALDDAVDGRGACIVVEGKAGLGKSRLLSEAGTQARARKITVLSARATEGERTVPFAVALGLVVPLLASASDLEARRWLSGGASLVTSILPGEHQPAPTRIDDPGYGEDSGSALLHALVWLVANVARGGPVLVVVDDAHWADEVSLRFLTKLVRSVEGMTASVLLAVRQGVGTTTAGALAELLSTPQALHLPLAPLTTAQVAELVRDNIPGAGRDLAAACAAASGGNPFHLQELLRAVRADGLAADGELARRVTDLGQLAVGRAALLRLARLGAPAIAVARSLAVLGDKAPLRRIAALAGLPLSVAAAAVHDLSVEGLVTAAREPEFAHPLIVEMILAELSQLESAQAHGHAARLLMGDHEPPERIAVHLLASLPAGEAAAVSVLRVAAARAVHRGAPEVAVAHLARAVAEPPVPSELGPVLLELAAAQLAAGDRGALETAERALDVVHDLPAQVHARRLLSRALASVGRRGEAAECLEAALALVGQEALDESNETVERTQLLLEYLSYAVFEPGQRQRAMNQAAALVHAGVDVEHFTGATPAERVVLAAAALRSGQLGQPAELTTSLAERAWSSGALLDDGGPESASCLAVVWAFALAGDHRRHVAVTTSMYGEARRRGSVEGMVVAGLFRGNGLLTAGRLTAAFSQISGAVELAEQAGLSTLRMSAVSTLAMIATAMGDLDRALVFLEQARQLDGDNFETAWRLHAEAVYAAARRDTASALRLHLEAGTWLAERLNVLDVTVLPWRTEAARVAVLEGDAALAQELVAAELRLADQIHDPGRRGRALAASALLTPDESGAQTLECACRLLQDAGELFELARAQRDLGRLLRRRGDRTTAREILLKALDNAVQLGAGGLAESVRTELAAVGARPRVDRLSGPGALTPSERRIAELAADGLTNAKIAQVAFVTPKTVEYHLRNAFAKLSVTSRAQLPDALAEE